MEFYSSVKKNEVITLAVNWMQMKIIMLCEIGPNLSHVGSRYCVFVCICGGVHVYECGVYMNIYEYVCICVYVHIGMCMHVYKCECVVSHV